jgi:serine/threonine-protein kinase
MANADDVDTRSWPDVGARSSALDANAMIGRYRLGPRIAVGGMGTVSFGLMTGAAGFSRVVAIKRLHPHYSQDPFLAERFKEEIWMSARIQHPNVVEVLDVVQQGEELLFVMEYVRGDTLRSLQLDAAARKQTMPLEVAAGILVPALHGLHAAHEARDDCGNPLEIVHRDVSPQNLLIGRDGQVKVLDFGIAKAALHSQATRPGRISGKVAYLSPEQALGWELDPRSDVFAAGTVLWETLVGARLFRTNDMPDAAVLSNVLNMVIPPPCSLRPDIPQALDRVVMRALERDRNLRFQSAAELAQAVEAAVSPASMHAVGQWFAEVCADRLRVREELLASFREPAGAVVDDVTDSVERRFIQDTATSTQLALTGSITLTPEVPAHAVTRKPRRAGRVVALLSLFGAAIVSWLASDAFTTHTGTGLGSGAARAAAALSSPPGSMPRPSGEARKSEAFLEPSQAQLAPIAPPSAPASATSGEPSAGAPRARSRSIAHGTRALVPKPRPAKAPCDPPTYVDSAGIRHFKEQCL